MIAPHDLCRSWTGRAFRKKTSCRLLVLAGLHETLVHGDARALSDECLLVPSVASFDVVESELPVALEILRREQNSGFCRSSSTVAICWQSIGCQKGDADVLVGGKIQHHTREGERSSLCRPAIPVVPKIEGNMRTVMIVVGLCR